MKDLLYIVIVLGIINLLRLGIFMVSADLYDLRKMWQARHKAKDSVPTKPYQPFISVIIPAHNEEVCIIRTIESVLANDYGRKQVIVVDDGSTDSTYNKLRYYKRKHKVPQLKVVHQKNGGKASALNNAFKNHARGSLVMVLDADSLLHPNALSRIVKHFSDKSLAAAASNVKVIEGQQILNVAQRLEYVVSYRMKRALSVLNMEYIIGGVGSTFRKAIVKECDYYDDDTMTEDIDFTLKVIAHKGNRAHKIIFAADVITYTEGVTTFKGLLKQRFRWKYGRMQTFMKNPQLFFSANSKYSKQLSWFYLPFVVFSEGMLLIEPILTGFVLYISLRFSGLPGLLSVYLVVSLFSLINIISEETEVVKNKLKLIGLVPITYPLLMIMSSVDFIVLVKSIRRFRALLKGTGGGSKWHHVKRSGAVVEIS